MSDLLPGTPHYYASELLPSAIQKFGEAEIPSTDLEFIAFVYRGRAKLLEREGPAELPEGIDAFVQERLGRCGFHAFKADAGSIAELWDIFDDYEFQELMGRIP